jgi:hypothetical protein
VPLTCTFLALLSHPSHQMAGVDSISLVISLVASPQESRCPARMEHGSAVDGDQISGAAARIACVAGSSRHGSGGG